MPKLLQINVKNTFISFWLQFAVSCTDVGCLQVNGPWREQKVHGIGQNAILDPIVYCLTVIKL